MQPQQMGKLLKGLSEMQKRMEAAQKALSEADFEGEAANGLVKVVMSGKGELKSLRLDPSVLTEDNETVADLIVVASRKAYDAKEKKAKEQLSGMASGLLPLGMKLPGFGI